MPSWEPSDAARNVAARLDFPPPTSNASKHSCPPKASMPRSPRCMASATPPRSTSARIQPSVSRNVNSRPTCSTSAATCTTLSSPWNSSTGFGIPSPSPRSPRCKNNFATTWKPRGASQAHTSKESPSMETSLADRVQNALATTLAPALRESGLELRVAGVDADGVARVQVVGSCASCPSTTMTLIMGIERQLQELVPEVAYLEITQG